MKTASNYDKIRLIVIDPEMTFYYFCYCCLALLLLFTFFVFIN